MSWKDNVKLGPKGVEFKGNENIGFNAMCCKWCEKIFDGGLAACRGGQTWTLYKCPYCEKFIARGWVIPDEARDPDTKVIEIDPPNWVNTLRSAQKPDDGLVHVLWRVAKQLVSLLEKKYRFCQTKELYIGKDLSEPIKPWRVPLGHRAGISLRPGMRVREEGKEWPIYHIGSTIYDQPAVFCQWETGNVSGFGDYEKLERLAIEGKLEIL